MRLPWSPEGQCRPPRDMEPRLSQRRGSACGCWEQRQPKAGRCSFFLFLHQPGRCRCLSCSVLSVFPKDKHDACNIPVVSVTAPGTRAASDYLSPQSCQTELCLLASCFRCIYLPYFEGLMTGISIPFQ